jgi:hypothetical protein
MRCVTRRTIWRVRSRIQVKARRIPFERSPGGMYVVVLDGRELTLNTQNIRAEVVRDNDTSEIGRFLDNVANAQVSLPEWVHAKAHLFPMIESIDVELGEETVSRELTDRTKVVLAFYQPGSGSLRFVTEADLATWGTSVDEAWSVAESSFAGLVARTKIEVLKAGDLALGTVHVHAPYKASVILSPALKQQLPVEMGWPVLAVAPARDFVYLIRKDDQESLGRIGAVVVREFRQSGYPVSTEVWELSDDGAKAMGEFPVD